jgi:RHS repeat-associated protein
VYAPFGAIIHDDSLLNSSNKWRYSCESFDDCIGVYYYNFRHYSTEDGRWFSRDPLVEPDIKNIYSFVANNVINNTDFLGLDVVDDYMERLKDNAAIISQMNCDFLLACDYVASNNQKYNARSVCIRIQRDLKKLFPNKGISILKDYTAGGLKKAIDDAKCLCGIVYVGHVGIRSGDNPTRLIFNERSSLVSDYRDSDKEVERIPIADIDSAKFSKCSMSAIFGCRSGLSAGYYTYDIWYSPGCQPIKTYHKTHDSFAEAFAKRTRSTVFGTDRKVNFCNGQITSSLIPPKLYEFNGE